MATLYVEEISDNEEDTTSIKEEYEAAELEGTQSICTSSNNCVFDVSIDGIRNKENSNFELAENTLTPISLETKVLSTHSGHHGTGLEGGGSTLNVIHEKAYLFGGCSNSGVVSNALHCYDLKTNEWIYNVKCEGSLPSPRFGHSATVFQDCLYIIGGQGPTTTAHIQKSTSHQHSEQQSITEDNMTSFSDVYCLNTETLLWTRINDTSIASIVRTDSIDEGRSPILPSRNSHTASLFTKMIENETKNKIIVFGGANDDGPMNDVWSLCLETFQWEEFTQSECFDHHKSSKCIPLPSPREMHVTCVDQDKDSIIIMGGREQNGQVCQDLWSFNLVTKSWKELTKPPSPLCAHVGVPLKMSDNDDTFLYFHGGWNGTDTIFSNSIIYNLSRDEWNTTNDELGLNIPRLAHSCDSIDERRVLIFGGTNAVSDLGDLIMVSLK